jgi:peptide/nickel transport system substrate-binding protein
MTDTRRPEQAATSTVLRLLGPADGEMPAEVAAHSVGTGQLLLLLTRQLFAYPAGGGPAAGGPVPDAAADLPTLANGGISEDGCTYRIRIRDGIRWDAQAAREVTAADFVRGLKRTAHPGARAMRPFLTELIVGLGDYYGAYDEAFGHWQAHAPALAQFQHQTSIAGVRAEDDKTLVLRLTAPANDLVDILASGWVTAASREYDYYVPDSPELYRSSPSAGPYRIVRRLSPGGDFALEPNPRWDPATDPVRSRPAGRIEVTLPPPDLDAAYGVVAAGGFAPAWGLGVHSWTVPETATIDGYGGPRSLCYLSFGSGPEDRRVPVAVREALTYAVDRASLAAAARVVGAHNVVPQYGVLPAGLPTGAVPMPVGGDPARSQRLLATAGVTGGVRLTLAVPPVSRLSALAARLVAGAATAGITLIAVPGTEPADVVLREWTPLWAGHPGRDLLHRLWRESGPGDRSAATRFAEQALAEADPPLAAATWQRFDELATAELRIVPLVAAAWPHLARAAATGGSARWRGGPH